MNRVVLLVFALVWTAGQTSRGGTGEADAFPTIVLSEDDRAALASLGEGVIGGALPAIPFDPHAFFPLRESETVYRVVEGRNAGSEKTLRLTPEKRGSKPVWRWVLDKRETVILESLGDQSIGIRNEFDHRHDVFSIFEPPETILDTRLRPNEPHTRTIDVRVFGIGAPDKVKHSGALVSTDTYLGMHRLTTPAGSFDCVLIRTTYEGKVGPGKISDLFYRFYAEGRGLVAAVIHETVTALVVYNEKKKLSFVLVDGPRRLSSPD